MAIQINGTDVIDNSKNIVNVNDAKMTGTVLSKQTAFAYALVDGSGNFSDNYNFSSCVKVSGTAGRLRFTFATAPAGAPNNAKNYVVLVQPDSTNAFDVSRVRNRSQTCFDVYSFNGSTARDKNVFVLVFSDAPR